MPPEVVTHSSPSDRTFPQHFDGNSTEFDHDESHKLFLITGAQKFVCPVDRNTKFQNPLKLFEEVEQCQITSPSGLTSTLSLMQVMYTKYQLVRGFDFHSCEFLKQGNVD